MHRWPRLVVVFGLVVFGCVAPAAYAAPAADVTGDDGSDRYVGTGGLILPGSVAEETRRTVAACDGCAWRLSTPCVEPAVGTPFDGQSACTSVVRGCPHGELLRAWFRGAGEQWREIGLVCVGPGGPLTIRQVGGDVAQRVAEAVPPLAPARQPAAGALAQLPVLFDSGQPAGPQAWEWSLDGHPVAVTASPRWSWTFGDGARLETDDPGGRHPRATVAHVYRRAGTPVVRCTTTWRASFTVAGLGPFEVAEPVVQEERLAVRVGEGRALLTPPPR